MSLYQPKSYLVEAKKLGLLTFEEIEKLVGGDSGRCPVNHQGCLIFATKKGALHVRIGQYVVKHENGEFEVEDQKYFELKYDAVQRNPHGG